ncbi:MAG: hypothetical protein ACM3O3_05270 [Syntrophothermus sp.]
MLTLTNWSGFGNQPDDDGVEIVSNSASDTGECTIWGTDHDTGVLCYETVTLTGTTPVSTTKTDWGNIIGIFLGRETGKNITAAVGTITIREASGNATITTITAGVFHAGMLILRVPGKNIEIGNFSGNLWWHNFKTVTSSIGVKENGIVNVCVNTKEYISLISDNTGASVQVVVMEN